MKFSEKWLREWIDPPCSLQVLADQLTMAGLEVDSIENLPERQDSVIEVDLTPNRGDCLSVLGIAREVSVLNKMHCAPVQSLLDVTSRATLGLAGIAVHVQAPKACPRYLGRMIRGIRPPDQINLPTEILARLADSQVRSIHPVVDLLNYVMLELGQPLHAFDAATLVGDIVVRYAFDAEEIVLLDDRSVILEANTLVIADAHEAHAIAGVMGGKKSGVTEKSQAVFLESALFMPAVMAGKARRYGLHTEASFRFERGVDHNIQEKAIERATQLILRYCAGEAGECIEVVHAECLPQVPEIRLAYAHVKRVLGISPAIEEITDILTRLGCEVVFRKDLSDPAWTVKPPSYRYDLNETVDLIEEIARITGYDEIPYSLPQATVQINGAQAHASLSRIKRSLVDQGFQEVITYSFVDDLLQKKLFPEQTAYALLNPLSEKMNVMRLSLLPGLLSTVLYNQNRQQTQMKLFETGLCFVHTPAGVLEQENRIGGLICGNLDAPHWDQKSRPVDFFDVKQVIESWWALLGYAQNLSFVVESENTAYHPGQCAKIFWQEKQLGVVGKLHPSIQQEMGLEGPIFSFELMLAPIQQIAETVFMRPSRFPEIRRDLAIVVDQACSAHSLVNLITNESSEILREVKIFDVYQGKGIEPGKKSIAMGLILQHPSRTLVDQEVNELVLRVVAGLEREFSAKLRD